MAWELVAPNSLRATEYANFTDTFPAAENTPALPYWNHPKSPQYKKTFDMEGEDITIDAPSLSMPKMETVQDWASIGEGSSRIATSVRAESWALQWDNTGTYAGRNMELLNGSYFFISYGTRYVDLPQSSDQPPRTIKAMDLGVDRVSSMQARFARVTPRYSISIGTPSQGKLFDATLTLASVAVQVQGGPQLKIALAVTQTSINVMKAALTIAGDEPGEDASIRISGMVHATAPYHLGPNLNRELPSLRNISILPEGFNVDFFLNTGEVREGVPSGLFIQRAGLDVGTMVIGLVRATSSVKLRSRRAGGPVSVSASAEILSNDNDSVEEPGSGINTIWVRLEGS